MQKRKSDRDIKQGGIVPGLVKKVTATRLKRRETKEIFIRRESWKKGFPFLAFCAMIIKNCPKEEAE